MDRRGALRGARPVRAAAHRARAVRGARQRGRCGAQARHRPRQPIPPHAPAGPRATAHRDGMTRAARSRPARPPEPVSRVLAPWAARPMHRRRAVSTRTPAMRTLVLALLGVLGPALVTGQDTAIVIQPESAGVTVQPLELPRLVAEEAIRLYNAPSTTRLVGRSRLPRGNEWRGDVAVRNGAVWVGGRVQGTVLVINGDAVLDSTAAITGDLIVVGGTALRAGEVPAYGLEFRAYDVVAPVEDWGLRGAEVGWEAFLFQRDYRDYYLNKGIAGRASFQAERPLSFALEVRRDWQTSVTARDPWTVFRNDQAWRPNPPIDDGHYTTVSGVATLDTRNDPAEPSAGWYLRAQFDNSRSKDVSPQTGVPTAVRAPIPTDGSYQFSRLDRKSTRLNSSHTVISYAVFCLKK